MSRAGCRHTRPTGLPPTLGARLRQDGFYGEGHDQTIAAHRRRRRQDLNGPFRLGLRGQLRRLSTVNLA